MGLYYSTDFVLRWYKADDSLLEQDHGRTQYTVIDTDKLVALREQDTSSASIRTWLETNGVPPDGHRPPYDGTMPDELLSGMEVGITNARAVSRAYAVLDDDSVMESGTFLALSELRKLFVPQETREQHTQRILDIESRMPRFLAEKYKYTDECLRVLMGRAPLQSNYLATGYDSEKKKRQLVSPTINTLLYAAIVNEQVGHVQYRKCLLCDNYFQLSNHKTRMYCDVHMITSY